MKKPIIFDFDGVIVDTIQLSYSINKESAADLEYSEWQKAYWLGFIYAEGNVYKNIRKELSGEEYQNSFFKKYSVGIANLVPIEGMHEVIEELAKEYVLVIVSSASQGPIKDFLEKFKLDQHFFEILGRETNSNKVEKFHIILNKYKIKPQETLIITDTVGDIKEAHQVGIKSIGVIWGVHDHNKLAQADPHFIAKSPSEIVTGIKSIL